MKQKMCEVKIRNKNRECSFVKTKERCEAQQKEKSQNQVLVQKKQSEI